MIFPFNKFLLSPYIGLTPIAAFLYSQAPSLPYPQAMPEQVHQCACTTAFPLSFFPVRAIMQDKPLFQIDRRLYSATSPLVSASSLQAHLSNSGSYTTSSHPFHASACMKHKHKY